MSQNMFIEPGNLITSYGFTAGARSGLMTGIAADADVYGLRNCAQVLPIQSRAVAITSMQVLFFTTTEATAVGSFAVAFYKVLGFTTIHPTGTPVPFLARHKRLPNVAANSATPVADVNQAIPIAEISGAISGTAAISAAVYTAPDADEPFHVAAASAVNGVTATTGSVTLQSLWLPSDGMPIVLGPDEGIVGKLLATMPTALVGRMCVIPQGYRH